MIPVRVLGDGQPEVFFRVIVPAFASRPRSGQGAAKQGGRFNRPGQEALYLAGDVPTALAEYQQDNPWISPGTICTFFTQGLRVADFSKGFDAARWPLLWADFAVDWRSEWFGRSVEPPTWYMADDVLALGLDGVLFPSQAKAGGVNLVIYDSSIRSEDQLSVYDPDGNLNALGRS